AQQTHDPTADDGAADTEQNVSDHTVAAAHDLAGHPACDQADDNPPQQMHTNSSLRGTRTDPAAVLELDEPGRAEGVPLRGNSELLASASCPALFSRGNEDRSIVPAGENREIRWPGVMIVGQFLTRYGREWVEVQFGLS